MMLPPLLLAGMALDAHADELRRPYLVQLHGQPIASYTGTMAGLPATRPAPGQRLDLHGTAVRRYTGYLVRHQDAVRAQVAGAPLLHRYQVVLNGFAALLTDDEVRRLQADANVARITADVPHHPQTNYTPTFLGLDRPDGLWNQLGGPGHAGEDVVIGMIDTGVWPENPAYADRVDADGHPSFAPSASLAYGPPTGWRGSCQVGEGYTVANCNNKLIGARYFDAGFQASGKSLHWSEFRSPRDSLGNPAGQGGHGSHTSSTAGGNHGVPANVAGIPMGQVSGMAPRARLAMYKVCWTYNDPGDDAGQNSCWTSDSVAAIEQAVLDGVHVINYSISGSNTIADPVEQAFLHAADAGVFVAASAGNAGPGDTVAHLSPWLTTVGASTHNRLMQATVTLGNGAQVDGASLNTTPLPAGTPIVRAEDAGLAGADPSAVKLCFSAGTNGGNPALDPAKAAGKIVVCTRGTSARVDKSLAVLQAGGVGMVMVDNGAGLVAEVHSVPTIHVTAADGAHIQAYARTPGASAAFSTFRIGIGSAPAPVMANFSSRGPNLFDPNVLKPDLTAPGVDILAGVTPALTLAQHADIVNGTLVPPPAWAFYQGTSMSSPHVAGVAALLRQRHPGWSPAAIKSALMTSATPTFPDSNTGMAQGTLPWGQGAGHLNPNGAADPGLVYDLGPADYQKYLCGTGLGTDCAGGAVAGYNLNLASITVNNVLGTTVVNRAVTNVGAATATYTASVEVPGYTAIVTPASLTLAPGQTLPFTVALTRAGAPDNAWQYGQLRWSDGSHVVTSPVTVRSGRPVDAPAFTYGTLATASRAIGIGTGFSGRMGLATGGLKEVSRSGLLNVRQAAPGSVDTLEQIAAACNAAGDGVRVLPFTVPSDTVVATFELFNRDTSSGNGDDDLDLALLDASGALVATSLHGGADEAIRLSSPPAGAYRACVIGYAAADGVSTDFTLSSAIVTRADTGGGLKAIGPSKVYVGGTATVAVSWTGLAPGQRYYGGVQYLDLAGNVAATTMIEVETNNPLPLAPASGHRPPTDTGQ
ncbi:MAG TPA: S8 family serine peptidase [Burkholderiaceae bacterium]|nr:S8 family serine peptidase [Burkholderiaceae bacterium]